MWLKISSEKGTLLADERSGGVFDCECDCVEWSHKDTQPCGGSQCAFSRPYPGPSSTLTLICRTRASITFPKKARSGRASQARVGDSANPCSGSVAPDRKDGRSQRVEPASKGRRGESSQSLGWPCRLPWKYQRWWASPGARKAGERRLATGGALGRSTLLIVRQSLSPSV